ncbi:MAG: hypothetical protein RLZZ176_674 [Cyanobacteriota bacterium]|jgi:hypothetical protein
MLSDVFGELVEPNPTKDFFRDTPVSPEILDFGILAFFGVVALLL